MLIFRCVSGRSALCQRIVISIQDQWNSDFIRADMAEVVKDFLQVLVGKLKCVSAFNLSPQPVAAERSQCPERQYEVSKSCKDAPQVLTRGFLTELAQNSGIPLAPGWRFCRSCELLYL